jgi:hypothetical protein
MLCGAHRSREVSLGVSDAAAFNSSTGVTAETASVCAKYLACLAEARARYSSMSDRRNATRPRAVAAGPAAAGGGKREFCPLQNCMQEKMRCPALHPALHSPVHISALDLCPSDIAIELVRHGHCIASKNINGIAETISRAPYQVWYASRSRLEPGHTPHTKFTCIECLIVTPLRTRDRRRIQCFGRRIAAKRSDSEILLARTPPLGVDCTFCRPAHPSKFHIIIHHSHMSHAAQGGTTG